MPLTALQIKASKPADRPFTLSDSSGLALLVKPNGSKYWHFRYTYQGRAARMSLGVYPHISLQKARERAAECRNLLKQGTNPGAKRRDGSLRKMGGNRF